MPKRRVVVIVVSVLVVLGGVSVWLLMRTDSSTPSHHVNTSGASGTPSTQEIVKTLSPENVVVLQKIGSRNEKSKALVSWARTDEMFETLGSGELIVDIVSETFQAHELYATVDARLSGAATSKVTFYLQPSDGFWLIAGQAKG